MLRTSTISALFVAVLFALPAVGQPPGGADKKQPRGDKVQPANPTDAAISAALANDPDVKVARAKVQLAEAELAKAKQSVVLKVMTLMVSIKEQKSVVEMARVRVATADAMFNRAVIDQAKVLEERAKLESAQATLLRMETELSLLTGSGKEFRQIKQPDEYADALTLVTLAWHNTRLRAEAIQGPIPDRIRAALDKPVKLGAKGEKFTFEQALEVFKREAGLDVPVRGEARLKAIVSEGVELPVGAWFQLFADENLEAGFFVREYGLLIAPKSAAPPDAPTVTEFWKLKPAPEPQQGK